MECTQKWLANHPDVTIVKIDGSGKNIKKALYKGKEKKSKKEMCITQEIVVLEASCKKDNASNFQGDPSKAAVLHPVGAAHPPLNHQRVVTHGKKFSHPMQTRKQHQIDGFHDIPVTAAKQQSGITLPETSLKLNLWPSQTLVFTGKSCFTDQDCVGDRQFSKQQKSKDNSEDGCHEMEDNNSVKPQERYNPKRKRKPPARYNPGQSGRVRKVAGSKKLEIELPHNCSLFPESEMIHTFASIAKAYNCTISFGGQLIHNLEGNCFMQHPDGRNTLQQYQGCTNPSFSGTPFVPSTPCTNKELSSKSSVRTENSPKMTRCLVSNESLKMLQSLGWNIKRDKPIPAGDEMEMFYPEVVLST